MTKKCELCGRAYARKALTPVWYPHDNVCDRANCRHAAKDAVEAVERDRENLSRLLSGIATRHKAQYAPVGWRDDAMAKIDVVDNEQWWANEVVKHIG